MYAENAKSQSEDVKWVSLLAYTPRESGTQMCNPHADHGMHSVNVRSDIPNRQCGIWLTNALLSRTMQPSRSDLKLQIRHAVAMIRSETPNPE